MAESGSGGHKKVAGSSDVRGSFRGGCRKNGRDLAAMQRPFGNVPEKIRQIFTLEPGLKFFSPY